MWLFVGYPKEPDANCDTSHPHPDTTFSFTQGTVLILAKNIPLHRYFEQKLFTNPNGAPDNDNDYPIRYSFFFF